MWVIYAFASALFAGITAILAKIGIKRTDSYVATALRTVVVLVFAWLMVFIVGSQKTIGEISRKSLLFLCLSGITTGGSWICYFRALQFGDVSKVAPIDKSSTVITMLLSFLILREPVSGTMLAGMAAIGAGTLLMIQKKKEENYTGKGENSSRHSWIVYAVLSAVFASLTSILGKIGIEQTESNLGTAIRTLVVLLMAWIIVFALGKQKEIRDIDKKSWFFIGVSGITTGLSWMFYYRALQEGRASIVVPIDKMSIVVTVVFAEIFLKEKLSGKAFLGLLLLTVGTLLLLV